MKRHRQVWIGLLMALMFAVPVGYAAYLVPGSTTLNNGAGQELGDTLPGQSTLPLVTVPANPFTPVPVPLRQPTSRAGNFLNAIGRFTNYITDGRYYLSFAPPMSSPDRAQPAAVVALSPNPALQCPFTAAVNQAASAQVITNTGGKSIHVCGIVLTSATQQGLSVSEGTGSTCATGQVYWDGGSGGTVQAAANGGYAAVSDRIIYPMQVPGDNVCVIQSSTGNVSGHINYGIYP